MKEKQLEEISYDAGEAEKELIQQIQVDPYHQ
jgi:hypothetical protein